MDLLNLSLYLPLAGLLGIWAVRRNESLVRWVTLLTTVLAFAASLPLLFNFDISRAHELQFLTEGGRFVPDLDISYLVGLDGLSLLLYLLTTFMAPIVVISAWDSVHKHVTGFHSMLLLLQTGSLGVFAAQDAVLFYVFFELSLIPMYFLIGIWGGSGRIAATLKFFVYTLVGSLIMLVALIYTGYDAGHAVNGGVFTSDMRIWTGAEYQIGLVQQTWLFLAFALAFCIKVPLFPFHTWLPFAHTEAPTAGSVVLAAIMLKMGTYGLIRFVLPMFPNASEAFAPLMGTLAVIGIVYGALVAMVQKDVKKLVAYSSVSHLGFVVLGIFAMTTTAVQGAVIQNINHGLSTGALFLLVGMIYDRRHTRMIADFGGIASSMPVFAVMFMVATMASVGLPGLNGFVGEFLILLGSFDSAALGSIWFTVVATTGVILAAVYMLWMVQRVFFGPMTHDENKSLTDLDARETGLLIPIMIFIVWIGVYPSLFTGYSEGHIRHLLEQSKLKAERVLAATETAALPAWARDLYDATEDLAATK